jgi:hypothetical protein
MPKIINDAQIKIVGTLEDVKVIIDKFFLDGASVMNEPHIVIQVIKEKPAAKAAKASK